MSYVNDKNTKHSNIILVKEDIKYEIKSSVIRNKTDNGYGNITYIINNKYGIDAYSEYIDMANKDISGIESLRETDLESWFVEYKSILEKYSDFIDSKTIYDYYTDEEIEVLHRIVEAECEGLDFDKKVNVSNVIFNRLNDDRFPDNPIDVVFQKNPIQFSPISDGRYYKVEPQEDSLLALEYAFMFPDTTNGALYFEATYSNEMDGDILCDGSHKFYK